MSAPLYEIFTSTSLLTLGLYNLTTTIHSHLKSPTTFSATPIPSLPFLSHRLRHLPRHLTSGALLLSFLHHSMSSSTPDPLLRAHSFLSLTSASLSLLFLLLSLSLSLPFLPSPLSFASASSGFYLLYSHSAALSSLLSSTSALESHLLSVSSRVFILSTILSLALAVSPRLFVADIALSASVILQGLWALQTGLTLHVDAFVPEGCHKLLDVVAGVAGSTKCELDESRIRAAAILDLMFVVYVVVVVVIVFGVYALVSRLAGVSIRRFGSYEALPNAVVVAADASSHVELKTLTGTQA